jgi:lipoprotein signal peptidase
LRLIHVTNTGASFGILQDQSFFLSIVAFIGILVILLFKFLFSHQVPGHDSRRDNRQPHRPPALRAGN